jgi:PBSX family phage terminase large subunit
MTWWNRPGFEGYDGIICDGSIRSGKTVAMTVGFVMWAMRSFEGQNFAICGKTIESLRRNVTSNLSNWLAGVFSFKEHRSENKIVVTAAGRTNTFYLFGGKDESSAALIQGITLAGILLDEVALMPRSFVEQAVARCSVTGSKLWFNCNPEGPSHWFYLNWVCEAKKLNMLRLHFTMDDNLSLSPEVKARYESLYSGVFYDRFIRGLWVVAEGLIYTMFNKDFHVVPSTPRPYEKYYLSCDYGTINPTSIGLWGLAAGKWYRVREYYFDSRKEGRQRTDEEHYTELEALAGDLHISAVIVDPSAASFIEVIRRHERYRVEKASNAVIDGIRDVATRLQCGDIFFCDCCTDCIREFGLYRWDEKSTTDRPIKENDHSMDDVRYFVHRVYAPDLLRFK